VLILKGDKVVCFDTLLEVLILKDLQVNIIHGNPPIFGVKHPPELKKPAEFAAQRAARAKPRGDPLAELGTREAIPPLTRATAAIICRLKRGIT
jgi:hypothetical protein